MTLIVFCLAMGTRTPLVLWLAAMACDTTIIVAYMIIKAVQP